MIFVGLDCGGSSSRLQAQDERGNLVFHAHAGPANLVSTSEQTLRNNLRAITSGCPVPDAVAGCFAGLINDQTRQGGINLLKELFPSALLRAEPDFAAAYTAFEEPIDLCVISGTGSIICSRTTGGFNKSGGGGYLLRDEGSGFSLGRALVAHYVRTPQTVSPQAISEIDKVFKATEPSEVVATLYKSARPAAKLAKLAKTLGAEASKGEVYALTLLEQNLSKLASVTADHILRYLPQQASLQVGLAGGVWKGHAIMKQTFCKALSQQLPNHQFSYIATSQPPVTGAVKLAKELIIGN